MTRDEALKQLRSLADPSVRNRNIRNGAGEDQFGVKSGDIRKVAKSIKNDPALSGALWETGNLDARMLAILIVKPTQLTAEEIDARVRSATSPQVADWLNAYLVKKHKDHETLRERWMADDDPWAARAGWNLTSIRVQKSPDGLDLAGLLDRLESEMGDADPASQWTMNFALVNIGIYHPEHRERAVAIGEKLGLYSDYPVPKGCTSPFAPAWINEMVSRLG